MALEYVVDGTGNVINVIGINGEEYEITTTKLKKKPFASSVGRLTHILMTIAEQTAAISDGNDEWISYGPFQNRKEFLVFKHSVSNCKHGRHAGFSHRMNIRFGEGNWSLNIINDTSKLISSFQIVVQK